MKLTIKRLALSAIVLASTLGLSQIGLSSAEAAGSGQEDQVLLKFATVGDSRGDSKKQQLNAQDANWQQNTKVIARITKEVQDAKDDLFVFNGDMIMGYYSDPTNKKAAAAYLNKQYSFWRGLVADMYETGTYVVPVPGNHELQDNLSTGKISTEANENTWRYNMGDVIMDTLRWKNMFGSEIQGWDENNYPKVGTGGITTSQSQLSYSFDLKDSHFAIINTDPAGNDSHAPTEWLKQDFESAKKRGLKHMFVFGHKYAFPYIIDPASAPTDSLHADLKSWDDFWQVIEDYNATYFSGHQHATNFSQPKGKAYQVIVGSGGSPFDAKNANHAAVDRMYTWANVTVYASGRVHIDNFGFDENFGQTQLILSLDLGAPINQLTLSGIKLDQPLTPSVFDYSAKVANSVTSTTVTATPVDSLAKVSFRLNGQAAANPIPLSVGKNTISVDVLAQDGKTTQTYTITVTREDKDGGNGNPGNGGNNPGGGNGNPGNGGNNPGNGGNSNPGNGGNNPGNGGNSNPGNSGSKPGTGGNSNSGNGGSKPGNDGNGNPGNGGNSKPGNGGSETGSSGVDNLKDIKGHWAESAIKQLISLQAVKGYPDGSFKPDQKVTRAEFVAMVVKAFGLQLQKDKTFSDTANHWARDFISTAYKQGIISGYNDQIFKPDANITREEMASIIAKTLGLKVSANGKKFTDDNHISNWARAAIAAASEKGIIGGYPDGKFNPSGNATRAEAAAVIIRAHICLQ
ncbi:S-layer homology domain-containing protein [Paenibacillus sp.]|jgi:hypothetical protein|uniref:S-layer homology domain-containing protein n=1 Tax=Paenibacillus sp. TaxID=58172 RepID=UPI00281A307D|nr:S-layer homology domain-containing protein [Paenibacillus sp.]MDR0269291.1 S-layer homology domain-containing protein [Paenibacillus sp.]